MTERPIIFSGSSVREILAGRKTQTRRVVKPQPFGAPARIGPHLTLEDGRCGFFDEERDYVCRHGGAGDRLWVKETFWCRNETCDHEYCAGCDMGSLLSLGEEYASIDYCATPTCQNPPAVKHDQTVAPNAGAVEPGDWWLAPPDGWDGEDDEAHTARGEWNFMPWRFFTKHPSIYMPRWASRVTLKIVGVRVERVQAITEADALAEGARSFTERFPDMPEQRLTTGEVAAESPHRSGFAVLWDEINAKRGFSWAANPWVWVIGFERIEA